MRLNLLFFLFVCKTLAFCAQAVDFVYVTYGLDDPCHQMWVVWQSSEPKSALLLKEGAEWKENAAESKQLLPKCYLHSILLKGLDADTLYSFKVKNDKEAYCFRTFTDSFGKKVKIAIGGDAYKYLYTYRQVCKEIAFHDPDFVVLGGDIAYTKRNWRWMKGEDWEMKRWSTFFKTWQKNLRGREGRLIPLVVAVGNHDIKTPAEDPFFSLFPQFKNQKAFGVYDLGKALSLFILDTGHVTPVKDQVLWLQEELNKREEVAIKIAAYHVSAYPTVYAYDGSRPKEVRNFWCPLFEKYNVKLCFENHNHAYKRTYRLTNGKIDPEGILYIGDGCWGVDPRDPKEENRWYLEKAEGINCFSIVTLQERGKALVESFGLEGEPIDKPLQVEFKASPTAVAKESRFAQ